jgi:outer membrane protein assembly factor BamB
MQMHGEIRGPALLLLSFSAFITQALLCLFDVRRVFEAGKPAISSIREGTRMKHFFSLLLRRPLLYTLPLLVGVLVFGIIYAAYSPRSAAHADTSNTWTTFLGSNARTSYDAAETTINPTTAPNLKVHWMASTTKAALITTQVMVANGMLYWGSWDGVLHASDPSTGKDIWTASLGTEPGGCSKKPKGIISSVTLATVTINGTPTSVVYAASGLGNVFAYNALTGVNIWETNLGTASGLFLYTSGTIHNGSLYMGVASTGDCPLVQGELVKLNDVTGHVQKIFKVVPDACPAGGGSVWGTPAIDKQTGMIYFGTGNVDAKTCKQALPMGEAVFELNASDLSFVAKWHIPSSDVVGNDDDFGSNPTLFQATINGVSHAMLGIVNKDGVYYALDRTNIAAGPLWKLRISVGGSEPSVNASIPGAAYDGTNLYVAGSGTTIGTQSCPGSLQALNPSNGTILWQDCLSASVLAPVLAVPGLLVVGVGNTMNVYNAQNGRVLFSYKDTLTNAGFWGAATICNGILYEGSKSGKLFAFGL